MRDFLLSWLGGFTVCERASGVIIACFNTFFKYVKQHNLFCYVCSRLDTVFREKTTVVQLGGLLSYFFVIVINDNVIPFSMDSCGECGLKNFC